jgi:cysteinyl-tRNA synthetase
VISAAFSDAMNDDLAVPTALATISEALKTGNSAITAGDKAVIASAPMKFVEHSMYWVATHLIQLLHQAAHGEDMTAALDGVIKLALEQRTAARERKDFAASDAIRDGLASLGITIEDTAQGPRWSISRDGQ